MKYSLDQAQVDSLLQRGSRLQKWQIELMAEAAREGAASLEDRFLLASSTKLDSSAREPLNPAWRRGLAELYETLAEMSYFTGAPHLSMREYLHDRAALAKLALSNYLTAFVLMGTDDARLALLWPMRQCAAAAGDRYLGNILRSIDQGSDPKK